MPVDVPRRHVLVAMLTLDLVREFKKLKGLDAALISDDTLGAVTHGLVFSPLSGSSSRIKSAFCGCCKT